MRGEGGYGFVTTKSELKYELRRKRRLYMKEK